MISSDVSSYDFIAGHSCNVPGCQDVLVIDGNMKNCRQVCAVGDVTTYSFKSIDGYSTTGNILI